MTNQENAQRVIRYIQSNVEGLKRKSGDDDTMLQTFKRIPQLNHLLLAISQAHRKHNFPCYGFEHTEEYKPKELCIFGYEDDGAFETKRETFYDLTKTVEENLKSNEALCNYCLTLFGL